MVFHPKRLHEFKKKLIKNKKNGQTLIIYNNINQKTEQLIFRGYKFLVDLAEHLPLQNRLLIPNQHLQK